MGVNTISLGADNSVPCTDAIKPREARLFRVSLLLQLVMQKVNLLEEEFPVGIRMSNDGVLLRDFWKRAVREPDRIYFLAYKPVFNRE